MSSVTKKTRLESYLAMLGKRAKKHREIIEVLLEQDKPITAKELAVKMFASGYIPTTDRNETAPRLTELESMDIVKVVGKTTCKYTGKTVALYKMKGDF